MVYLLPAQLFFVHWVYVQWAYRLSRLGSPGSFCAVLSQSLLLYFDIVILFVQLEDSGANHL